MANNKMVTKTTVWVLDSTTDIWHGRCIECKGEKAKYTPQALKNEGIKPCQTCTNIDEYDKHVAIKKEPAKKKESADEAKDDSSHIEKEPLDVYGNKLKVGDKVRFLSGAYDHCEEKVHGEILELTKSVFEAKESNKKDGYSEQSSTKYLAKVKDYINKETYTTIAKGLAKV